jgi:hypothetical protein
MKLVEKHIIKEKNKYFKQLQNLTHLSKNLYNAGLYAVRQYFFRTNQYLNYFELNKRFVAEKNIDYYALPSKVSQQALKLLVEVTQKSKKAVN